MPSQNQPGSTPKQSPGGKQQQQGSGGAGQQGGSHKEMDPKHPGQKSGQDMPKR
jgi:hypothetical protein